MAKRARKALPASFKQRSTKSGGGKVKRTVKSGGKTKLNSQFDKERKKRIVLRGKDK